MAAIQHYKTRLETLSEDDDYHPQYRPPVIPPSPTLSNPDMILPFDEGERESQTPSPPFNLPSLSHLQAFYGNVSLPGDRAQASNPKSNTDNSNHKNSDNNKNNNNNNNTNYSLANSRSSKKNLPRHANHRLSDIGEEEGPLPPPRRSSAHFGRFPVNAPITAQDWKVPASSPGVQGPTAEETSENNGSGSWSSSSGSTVSATSESAPPQQEESSEQKGTADAGKGHSLHMGVNDTVDNANGQGTPRDEASSAILSSEAERILENAKKRLTLMEGNLTRARSSMRNSPSLSASSSPSPANQPLGLGQPVGGLYQSISRSDRQASAALRPRPMYSTYQDAAGNRHSRVLSETNLPSIGQPTTPETNGLSRSVSAMGSSSLSSFQRDDKSFRYEPNRAYLTHRASMQSMQQPSPPPPADESTPSGSSAGLGIVTDGDSQTKISNLEDFNSVYPAREPPSRTQSQHQVHDLRDQMKGLHIKISSLKVKTQEDNLRRRSLQSLRTPSPLTEADPWYMNAMNYRDRRGHLSPNPSGPRTPEEAREDARDGQPPKDEPAQDRVISSGEEPATADAPKNDMDKAIEQPAEDDSPAGESLYEDAREDEYDSEPEDDIEIDREELDEILREPLDEDLTLESFPAVPQSSEATPHEEREDAFDYEHFILHSALGNFTQTKLRRTSDVSNTSVETTRPAHGRSARHSRANSAASVSSVATFATAAEEGNDFNGVLYWDRKFNDELRAHHYPESEDENAPEFETPMETPRTSRRYPPGRSSGHNPPSNGSLEPPPARSDSTTTGSATPTALASSLVSTVRAASSSPYPNTENENSGLNNDDERLLEQLFQSLGDVCMDLQAATTSADPDEKTVRVLRRRLDAARRVLDGELDS